MSRSSMKGATTEIGMKTDDNDIDSHRSGSDDSGVLSTHRGRNDHARGFPNRGICEVDGGPLHPDASNPNVNEFSLRKRYVNRLIDFALMAANLSQLKAVLDGELSSGYNTVVFAFILTSIVGQILLSFIFAVICGYEKQINSKREHSMPPAAASTCRGKPPIDYPKWIYRLDHISTGVVLIVVFSNCFISAFGIEIEKNYNNSLT